MTRLWAAQQRNCVSGAGDLSLNHNVQIGPETNPALPIQWVWGYFGRMELSTFLYLFHISSMVLVWLDGLKLKTVLLSHNFSGICKQIIRMCSVNLKHNATTRRLSWGLEAICSDLSTYCILGVSSDDRYMILFSRIVQLLITLVIQYVFMRDLEKLTGSLRIAIIYMGSGVAGNLASAIFVPYRADVSI